MAGLIKSIELKKEELLNLRFVEKLWYMINSEDLKFICWGTSDTSIVIDLFGLSEYLKSPDSILRVKNTVNFIRQMNVYGFKKSHTLSQHLVVGAEHDCYEFQHCSFDRNKKHLLPNIRRQQTKNDPPVFCKLFRPQSDNTVFYMNEENDPTLKKIQNPIQFNRVDNIRINLEQNYLKKYMARQIQNLELPKDPNEPMFIEIPQQYSEEEVDDSQLLKAKGVAGFYNTDCVDKLSSFFGDYLPLYSTDITIIPNEDLEQMSDEFGDLIPTYNIDLSDMGSTSDMDFLTTENIKFEFGNEILTNENDVYQQTAVDAQYLIDNDYEFDVNFQPDYEDKDSDMSKEIRDSICMYN